MKHKFEGAAHRSHSHCKSDSFANSKRSLESRIARLESLISNKKSVKNESLHQDMMNELHDIFDEHFACEDCYSSRREFILEMEGMADVANDMMVDDAIMYLCNEYGYDEDSLYSFRDDIEDALADMAQSVLDDLSHSDH